MKLVALTAVLAVPSVLAGHLRTISLHGANGSSGQEEKSTEQSAPEPWMLEESSDVFVRGNIVYYSPEGKDKPPANAVLKNPVLAMEEGQSQFWQVTLNNVSNRAYVGVTHANYTTSPPPKGYNFSFLGFGGDGSLVDGHRVVDPIWSMDDIHTGNYVIGVLAAVRNGTLDVYFWNGDTPLGKAFSFPASDYPHGVALAVQTRGPATVSAKRASAPGPAERAPNAAGNKGFTGFWQLERGPFRTPASGKLPVIRIHEDATTKSLMTTFKVVNLRKDLFMPQAGGGYKSQNVLMLCSAGEPDLMHLEEELEALFTGVTNLLLTDDSQTLEMVTDSSTSKLTRLPADYVNTITSLAQ